MLLGQNKKLTENQNKVVICFTNSILVLLVFPYCVIFCYKQKKGNVGQEKWRFSNFLYLFQHIRNGVVMQQRQYMEKRSFPFCTFTSVMPISDISAPLRKYFLSCFCLVLSWCVCVCILSETTLNGFDVKRMREEEGRNDRKRKHFFV